MPAHLAFPWLYGLVTAGTEEGSRARLDLDALLRLNGAREAIAEAEPGERMNAAAAAGVEIG